MKKCYGLFLVLAIMFGLSLSVSLDANAATAQSSQADVDFYNSGGSGQQIIATVSLPWQANVGGSTSNRRSFYLNRVAMWFPITANANAINVYGRIVMRFTPNFAPSYGETAYFCDHNLNDITSSVSGVGTQCTGTVVYHYGDGSTYSVNYPVYFNYDLNNLNAYVDYSQALPSTNLTGVSFVMAKTNNYDVYSTLNSYSLVLTTLVSDASYYVTDAGGGTDITPLITQNNTIINQNNTTNELLEQQTQQQQDQYVAEKQEESDREEQGQDDADEMAGIFNFSIPFILQPLFAGFTDANSCVQIPTLASWLHTEQTEFCPFFPANIRTVLTPILQISGSLLLFGFLVSWLKGDSSQEIEV